MELYGSMPRSARTYGKWFLELPEFWCRDRNYVRNKPYMNLPDHGWGTLDKKEFNVYSLKVDWLGPERVFDLRVSNWKEKLLTYISWLGFGWSNKGGLWAEDSPLDHILYKGNYNILSKSGYLWAVMNHGPDLNGNFVELWYYLSLEERPDDIYILSQLNSEDFYK